jgi:sarcosine oxidase
MRAMERSDILVLGLGAMGSAALYQSARRGLRAIGIDRFAPPHDYGSSHGGSRITRLAIGEGDPYTPLALRSHEIWRELERETGRRLLTQNGGLIISSPAPRAATHVADFFANTLAAAEKYHIAHERLDADAIRARFPQFRVRDNECGYYEPEAGFLSPEDCIRAQWECARHCRADIRVNERVLRLDAATDGVVVTTDKNVYAAKRLILAAGPWLGEFLPANAARYFRVTRQVQYWFALDEEARFDPAQCPVYIWELQGERQGIYGFPAMGGRENGVKIATEQGDAATTPDGVNRDVPPAEIAAMYAQYVAPYLTGIAEKCLKAVSCLYTVTVDSGFVVDRHPQWPHVLVASPCSGHGFKHSAAIGERLAQWAAEETHFDPGPFGFDRFSHYEGRQGPLWAF